MSTTSACFSCQSGFARAFFGADTEEPAAPALGTRSRRRGHPIFIRSRDAEIAGKLFLPDTKTAAPAVIVCHGAGDWKENFFELCEYLATRGIAALALDMHGHGQSGGNRFHVNAREWVGDIQSAIEYLNGNRRVDSRRIAAFGLAAGGTAILEAAKVDSRLKAIVALDATVHNSLSWPLTLAMKALLQLGKAKLWLTGKPLRAPLGKRLLPQVASDPDINRRVLGYPPSLEAFRNLPLPGAEQAFFTDVLNHISGVIAPTLVLWGEDDKLNPPATAYRLFDALTCKKKLRIVRGNGHWGHLDRNRAEVFELTAAWLSENLVTEPVVAIGN